MPSFALSEITRLASIPLSFTENRCERGDRGHARRGVSR